ncbi:MAG: histidinol dehydrogenase [Caldicoprobacterales bacterium]|jgi:histidinol dehydrogenase|nr:histidinol dehydrogenase [Clostridiales bacterium]
MIRTIDGRGKNTGWIVNSLNRPSQLEAHKEREVVLSVLKSVREEGDAALLRYTREFDRAELAGPEDLCVSKEEIEDAYKKMNSRQLDILEKAARRIRRFHEKQKQESWISFEEKGVLLGQKVTPMERVGVYVPGGKAAYPSSVLMNVIPALVAGVEEIIMVTPPGADGTINPSILAAARAAGAHRIYRAGGAQAIAALAYGTETIPKVDKIVGPGNIYVALAKREVYGHVDIDMIAGPSEIVVIADSSARPSYVAADLMSQAEHDTMASAILITDSVEIISEVKQELAMQIEKLPLKDTIRTSLHHYGACILVDTTEEAIRLSNALAPEHLELAIANPLDRLADIRHAGAVFLGHHSPEPVGDYMAGPNHVLPTSGTARFFSPLGTEDFVKKSSILFYDKEALRQIHQDAADFARMEGLTAHANAMEVRFSDDEEGISP